MKQAHTIDAANESQTEEKDFFLVGVLAANQYSARTKDNWVQLSPFGRFANVAGMQVFNADDATTIANEFNSTANVGVRAIGLPWYVGHPDHPDFKEQYKDAAAKGRVKELEVKCDPNCSACANFANQETRTPCDKHGLFGNVRWNDDGKTLIANEAFHGHSVNWRMKKSSDGWHPFSLKSVGFTNEPGIPVPPITAANEKGNMSAAAKKPTLLDYIKKFTGKDVANEDDAIGAMEEHATNSKKAMDDLTAQHNELTTKHGAMSTMVNAMTSRYGANEHGELPEATTTTLKTVISGGAVPDKDLVGVMANELATVATQRAELKKVGDDAIASIATVGVKPKEGENLLTVMANEIVTRSKNFVNERAAHTKHLLDMGVTGGFITAAERTNLEAEFANEATYESTMTKVLALKPKINVVSQVGALGKVSADVQMANQKTVAKTDAIVQAVNEYQDERQKSTGKRPAYIDAFAHVQKSRTDLFTASETTITR